MDAVFSRHIPLRMINVNSLFGNTADPTTYDSELTANS
jgi:hypothetical protein